MVTAIASGIIIEAVGRHDDPINYVCHCHGPQLPAPSGDLARAYVDPSRIPPV